MKVGPESAGAEPGPAAYGRGGERPTVTDARIVLGHMAAEGFGNEDVRIDADRAEASIAKHLARPLGWTVSQAAWGVLRLANANMAEMVRLATLRRGLDPRDFVLVAFGGAGPLHACEIAREVGIPKVAIPAYPGLFSAIGTMLGELRHDLVQTCLSRLTSAEPAQLLAGFARLEARAGDLIAAETTDRAADWHRERHADLRFEGQLFELTVQLGDDCEPTPDLLERRFRERHAVVYGYDLPSHPVEIVNLRLVARAPVWRGDHPRLSPQEPGGGARTRRVWDATGAAAEVDVVARVALEPGQALKGPAIVEDFGATIRVLEGQRATVRSSGVLEIEVGDVTA